MELPGYERIEPLGQSTKAILVRARSIADDVDVVIKLQTSTHATPEDVSRCEREYRIGRDLDVDGVVRPRAVEYFGHRIGLVMEDFGGTSLQSIIPAGGMGVDNFLRVAAPLAAALCQVHAAEVVHRDLNPSNVVVDPELRTVKIIDFGIATRLNRSTSSGNVGERSGGTLAYMAPEQTGRLNRALDHRADLYSLGATFYEMLTGRPPFPSADPLELVHCHLAVRPEPPSRLADVPAPISDLVLRLLEKEPERRYQSVDGLLHDLRAIDTAWRAGADLATVELGLADVVRHFAVPDRLYGREAESAALQRAFEAAAGGTTSLLLVSGPSGVGKTVLVQELARLTAVRRGYFIDGKADQYSGDVPYSSLVAAFRGLIRQVLGEPPERIAEWRSAIRGALDAGAAVVATVLPEIRLVIGDTGVPPEVGPTEAQNRFALAFRRFLSVFGGPDRPLVMFLDDLQWADSATLRLVRTLVTDPQQHHLLLIGAFRKEEIDPSHPLALLMSALEPAAFQRLEVQPLCGDDVAALVADSMGSSLPEVASLSALVHERTAGNPFFVGQFLLTLYTDGLIRFAADAGGWVWDLRAIRDRGVTDNVVDLMTERLTGLPADVRDVLGIAALIGNTFDLGLLAATVGAEPGTVVRRIEKARLAGLVLALGDGHERVIETDSEQDAGAAAYRFVHDRVQQACFAAVPAAAVAGLHLRAGRVMRDRLRHDAASDLFAVLDQLNAGLSAVVDAAEFRELAQLNLDAARRARSATAYESAASYVTTAIAALGEQGWTTDYQLSFDLHLLRAHVTAVLGAVPEAEAMFATVLRHARSATDKAIACDIQSEALHSAGRAHDAYLLGRAGLEHLGEAFPASPEDTAAEVERLMTALLTADVPGLLAAMPAGHAEADVAGRLFWRAMIGAYYSQPGDLPLVVGRSVEGALRRGYTRDTGLALGFLGMIAVMQGLHAHGDALAEAALDVGGRVEDPVARGRTTVVAWVLSLVWSHPFEASEAALDEAGTASFRVGDLEFVNHAMIGAYTSALLAGRDFGHLLDRCERWEEFCRTLAPIEHGQAMIRCAALRRLMGREGPDVDSEAIIAAYAADQDRTDVCESLMELARIENLFGNYCAAYEYSVRAAPDVVTGAAGTLLLTLLFRVHYAIACARLHAAEPDAGHLAVVDDLLAWLEPVAAFNPDNFASYVDLVRAERARAAGDGDRAMALYLRAVAHAGEHRYVLVEAHATELLARHCFEEGLRFAPTFLAEARALYLQCGATAKAGTLAAEFPSTDLVDGRTTESFTTPTTDSVGGRLDLATALKAALAIAGEIATDRVVERLIAISIENAGATRGVFVSASGEHLQVTAEGVAGGEGVTGHLGKLDELTHVVPAALVRSAARTGEPIVLTNALTDARLSGDPYLATHAPRSILVLPVVRTGQVEGVLYLENGLVTGAFTPDRLALLEVLSGQMAISLENARLVAGLEERVAERTRELSDALDELRDAQRQVVESEKLAALGGLVAGVAHEINTPVGIAVTATSHLVDRAAEFREAWSTGALKRTTLERFLETVEDSGRLVLTNLQRSADLVESFKQVAVDQSSEALRTIDVGGYLEDILRSLRPRLKATPHLVQIDAVPALSLTTYPGAVAQVVTNLVLNSIAHAYDPGIGGRLLITAQRRPAGVRLIYSDDGRGIDSATVERIFDPFFTTRRSEGGSGLGLHIVYNLVTQRLGGTVSVEGRPGQGAEFTVDLPDLETDHA
ncbi:MAG TPA: AAA family ATPase [Sporichthya sp.]|nr:AAA family ATPase [Sporichthya sp.]